MMLPTLGSSQELDSVNLKDISNWKIFDDSDEVMEPSNETGGVQAICVENDSNYWVATGSMVHQVINGVWNFHDYNYPKTDSVAFNVTDIFKCPFNSHIWFSSRYYGFRMYDGERWHIITNPALSNLTRVEFVREDKNSNVLIKGSSNRQVFWYIFNLNTNEVSDCTEQLKDQRYCKVILGKKGTFTTVNKKSILKYEKDEWVEYELPEGLTFEWNTVRRIAYHKKKLWILEQPLSMNYTTLYEINKNKLTSYEDLPKDLQYVKTFEADNQGRLWFGTLYNGFFVFDQPDWVNINLDNAMVGDQGDYTFKVYNGKCWFGSAKGLYIYDTNK